MKISPYVFITFEDSTQASLPSVVNSYTMVAKLFSLKKRKEKILFKSVKIIGTLIWEGRNERQ